MSQCPHRQQKHGDSAATNPKRRKAMASWFERQASSHQVQLGLVAVCSGLAVAGTILGAQAIRKEKRIEELKASIPELSESHHADMVLRKISQLMEAGIDCKSEAHRLWISFPST